MLFHGRRPLSLISNKVILIGCYENQQITIPAREKFKHFFGDFKGYGGNDIGTMVLQFASGEEKKLEYETSWASMAPMYYFSYWYTKFPILHKLRI